MERIDKGMVVHSSDGERLGKVVAVRGDTIVIEKGANLVEFDAQVAQDFGGDPLSFTYKPKQ